MSILIGLFVLESDPLKKMKQSKELKILKALKGPTAFNIGLQSADVIGSSQTQKMNVCVNAISGTLTLA